MAVLRLAQLDTVLRKRDSRIIAFLVYGPDAGKVREVARRIVAHVAGSLDDPFRIVTLEDQALSDDPAVLADELQSLAMGGGGRAIWIANAGAGLAALLPKTNLSMAGANRIVAEAGNLAKSAKLRTIFEASEEAGVIPCYEDNVGDLNELVDAVAEELGISVSDDARRRLLSVLGDDRTLSRAELEKVFLYARGDDAVTLAHVEAVASDRTGAEWDDLADAVFSGELQASDTLFHRLVEGGESGARALSALAMHVASLRRLMVEVDKGTPLGNAIRSARPPIFFDRKSKVEDQLRVWNAPALAAAAETTARAVLQTREFSSLEAQIAGRAVLALARQAASLRHKST